MFSVLKYIIIGCISFSDMQPIIIDSVFVYLRFVVNYKQSIIISKLLDRYFGKYIIRLCLKSFRIYGMIDTKIVAKARL